LTVWKALLLGLIQGLTEFLPISSSGHLVIGQHLLGIQEAELLFDTGVHFATMGAILFYFRKDIARLFIGFFGKGDLEGRHTANMIILGTIPAVIVGFLFKDFFEDLFNSPQAAAWFLLITGMILLSTLIAKPKKKYLWKVKWFDALVVGIAQAFAILPGISRSGSTIAAGLHLGIDRESAARFSFLLSLPAIFGAGILQLKDVISINSTELLPLFSGMLSAGISGYFAIAVMLKIVGKGKLYIFAPYCLILGIVVLFITN